MSGETSLDVRVWAVQPYRGSTTTTYRVRWRVGTYRQSRTFPRAAQADAFRSELLAATRRGEPFDLESGMPLSTVTTARDANWYDFACRYVDAKWPHTSPHHRKGIAECLSHATVALLTEQVEPTRAREIRSALLNWGYNSRRGSAAQPADVTRTLAWVRSHVRDLTDLAQPAVTRDVLARLSLRVDGSRASGRTAAWRRSVVSTALTWAVDDGLLAANPIRSTTWRAARSTQGVDRRVVVNPSQARDLLDAVRDTPRSGPRLVAFFGALYYSALRPEEATGLRVDDLDLPEGGWGWITLGRATPEVDSQWSDSGRRREVRELKHRAAGESRRVPCPPPLTDLLREHVATFDRRGSHLVFQGERGGPIAGVTYTRVWDRARHAALTAEQYASPLAARPYDLRHAAVSTWLNSGVPATQVAAWAGHSVHVLMRIYAKCVDGGEHASLERIGTALSS